MKHFFVFLIVISTLRTFVQTTSLYGEMHIESIIYQGDTLTFNPPKLIKISKVGKTSIISLGKLKLIEFAVQYELLKSNIGQSEYYMLGKCFYIKDSKDWKEISRFDYHKIEIEKGPPSEIANTFEGLYGAENDGND